MSLDGSNVFVTFSSVVELALGAAIVNPNFLKVDVGGGTFQAPLTMDWVDGLTWVGDMGDTPPPATPWVVEAVPLWSPELGIEVPLCQDPAFCLTQSGVTTTPP